MSEFFLKLMQSGLLGGLGDETIYLIGAVSVVIISYLLGSVNFCRMISKKLDIENDPYQMYPKLGNKLFLYYFLDGLKGMVCAIIGFILMPGAGYASVGMLFCVLGHGFPVFYKFKANGNCGTLACMFGCSLVVNPVVALIGFVIVTIVYFVSRYVSLSALIYALIFGFVNDRFMIWVFTSEEKNFVSTWNIVTSYGAPLIAMLVVILIYAMAFARLVRGKEEKTYFFQKIENLYEV